MKICNKCKIEKPETDFNKKIREKDGLQPFCRVCDNLRNKIHYKKNKQNWIVYRQKANETLKSWWQETKQSLSCVKCNDKRWYVLDFHHRDPSKKDLAVSQMVGKRWSKKRILMEINKCDVFCSNCHREYHHFEKMKD